MFIFTTELSTEEGGGGGEGRPNKATMANSFATASMGHHIQRGVVCTYSKCYGSSS